MPHHWDKTLVGWRCMYSYSRGRKMVQNHYKSHRLCKAHGRQQELEACVWVAARITTKAMSPWIPQSLKVCYNLHTSAIYQIMGLKTGSHGPNLLTACFCEYFFVTQPYLFVYVTFVNSFVQQQSWVVARETLWPRKLKHCFLALSIILLSTAIKL